MKIGILQLNFTVGDFRGNSEKLVSAYERAVREGAELCVGSELGLCGYPPRDLLNRRDFVESHERALREVAKRVGKVPLLIGGIEKTNQKTGRPLYNTAFLVEKGKTRAVARKILLPTYDVFDEDRYFEAGDKVGSVRIAGKRVGVTICEDIWNDEDLWPERRYRIDPVRELAKKGMDLLINLSASPWNIGKEKVRYRLLAEVAKREKIPVIQVNQVGGNDELVFDGRSLGVGVKGGLLAQGAAFMEDVKVVDIGGKEEKPVWAGDEEQVFQALVLGTRDYLQKCGFQEVVLGLSGGIDSALVAVVAAEALGKDKVLGVAMPSRFSSAGSLADAEALAKRLGIRYKEIPIEDTFAAMLRSIAPAREGRRGGLTEENLQSRIRGMTLMAISNDSGRLLLTTGNKSEMAVGYCTLYGDMCGALAVIADVPKTLVYRISRWINREREIIPKNSIEKAPSAELRPDQKDQDSLPPYEELDRILESYVVNEGSIQGMVKKGISKVLAEEMVRKIDISEYKRRQAAPGLKVTTKAFGVGRRIPLAQRFDPRGAVSGGKGNL
ncbi:MAG: NAD+ synthase [Verrucomicrobia bacterium]|nr:NAD+ synthase [Verrucomicrobiota bacterium]